MLLRQPRFTGICFGVLVGTLIAVSACATKTPTVATSAPSPQQKEDLFIINGKIWTGVTDPSGSAAEPTAMMIRHGRIAAIGSHLSVYSRVRDTARVIDAKGRRIIPGITDSHTHIVSGGFQLARLHLRDVPDRKSFVDAVASVAKTKGPGEWVVGGRWSVESWDDPRPPNKGWLDPVTGDVPVYLSRMDGHQALVNSAALRLAGIDASGPADPTGGEIERDPKTGEPTGVLKESAMNLVSRLIPDPTPDERLEALGRAMRHANSLGITSVHDMSSPSDLPVFRRAEELGDLSVRITSYLSVSDWAGHVNKIPSYRLQSDWVRLAGFKGFMDGSLGSRTAYMREPYSDLREDHPYPRGHLTDLANPPEEFNQAVAAVDSRWLQLAVHAIGDEGNHLLLDAYEYARGQNGGRRQRHRVEHAQHLHVSDIPRFRELGVVASMQPLHKADDGRYAEKALGKERLAGSYAYRQLVDAGALVIFGSDWPVVSLNPFAGMDAAVNAKTLAGDVWLPTHSLTMPEALRAYTVMPPRAINRDDHLGTLEVGKFADLVILSEDPFAIPKEGIGEVKADMTIVGGMIVFERLD